MPFPLHISPAVEAALAAGKPVVALESTIIAHGMPYPQNVQTARELEALIREEGCEPATLAVLNGQIKIGLTDPELELLGQEPDVMKASRRDLPYAISAKKHAATTVAATMILADMAGIRVFATGGIGGVHREAQKTFDISADLQELGQTSVAVVSAGAKAILDLKLTLEYLETMGVPVVGMGTDEFPAFYTPHSGLKLSLKLETPAEVANMLHTKWAMGLEGGVLIANPIPEKYAMPRHMVQNVVDQALREAKLSGIGGKSLTPYLLGRIKALTKGQSLFSNIALVKHNAQVAAQIARELANLPA